MGKYLFNPGNLFCTPSVLALAEHNQTEFEMLVVRHLSGDFGEYGTFADISVTQEEIEEGMGATADAGKLNKIAILTGRGQVDSCYEISSGQTILVITVLSGQDTYTTTLLPSER